jgi:copper homeostasis protein
MPHKILIEICAYSIDSALAAQSAGADRVELCANPLEGGTTPSHGAMEFARASLGIKLHVIIRPRGGDFLYSDADFAVMRSDIEFCRRTGVDGIVIGLLLPNGSVDMARTAELAALAHPMSVTFHRAFDMTADPFQALEDIISCGCSRVLTSGLRATAIEGASLIRELVIRARDRIVVMPGAGINDHNLSGLIRATGASEFHASARTTAASAMQFNNAEITFTAPATDNGLSHVATSSDLVKSLVRVASRLSGITRR